jgi:hypothetical protein
LGATVDRLFVERQGLVLGIFGAAASVGQLVFVPGLVWLLITIERREGTIVLAVMGFAVFFGLDYIATVALIADRFGRRHVGAVFGWVFFSHQVGAALAAYLGGVTRDSLQR